MAALLTVGGWTGSRYFSTAVGSAENRTQFARALLDIVDKYNLDGTATYRKPRQSAVSAARIKMAIRTDSPQIHNELNVSYTPIIVLKMLIISTGNSTGTVKVIQWLGEFMLCNLVYITSHITQITLP